MVNAMRSANASRPFSGDKPVTSATRLRRYRTVFGCTYSSRAALAGFRAAPAWPSAPTPVKADDLLPERALAGDSEARRVLRHDAYGAVVRAGGGLLETLDAYFAAGGVLESAARELYVHPNTVRYRLKRVSEVTGLSPLNGRDAFALRMALTIGRLDPAT